MVACPLLQAAFFITKELYMVKKSQADIDPTKDLAFIFKNVQCTIPANKKLCEWLLWMCDNYPESLRFLHRHAQAYVEHGGGSVYTFKRWSGKIKKDCTKQLEELNK